MRHEWDFASTESPELARQGLVAELNAQAESQGARDILELGIDYLGHELALVSSFGAEAIVLLHMVADVAPTLPVLFVDTGMMFPETLSYQEDVAKALGLSNLRRITPDPVVLRHADGDDRLHRTAPDDCCHIRKIAPLEAALLGFGAWVTGRKRHQTTTRGGMAVFEVDPVGRIKVNPLADWRPGDAAAYIDRHDLPRHPLVARGYASIGCAPCTVPVRHGDDPRAGRWPDRDKTECGIHFPNKGTAS